MVVRDLSMFWSRLQARSAASLHCTSMVRRSTEINSCRYGNSALPSHCVICPRENGQRIMITWTEKNEGHFPFLRCLSRNIYHINMQCQNRHIFAPNGACHNQGWVSRSQIVSQNLRSICDKHTIKLRLEKRVTGKDRKEIVSWTVTSGR